MTTPSPSPSEPASPVDRPPSGGPDRSTWLHLAYAIVFLGSLLYLLLRWRGRVVPG